jgi:hypothetical protein
MPNNLVDPPEHLRCTAKANRTGKRCRRGAIAGGSVCPTHGGQAPAVQRRAAERVALEQARQLLDLDTDTDPRAALLEAVKATRAALKAAEAALAADDADQHDFNQLVNVAVVSARVSKLALDARVEELIADKNMRLGEMVGGIITNVVRGLGLDTTTSARAFALVRAEVQDAHLDLGEIQTEITKVTEQLREHTLTDAEQGYPERLARAVQAGFAVLDLPDHEQERVVAAVEHFLVLERAERAEYLPAAKQPGSRAWWADSPRYDPERGNGGKRR